MFLAYILARAQQVLIVIYMFAVLLAYYTKEFY